MLQALYAFELSGDEAGHVIDTVLRPELGDDTKTFRFAERLFIRTIDTVEETDAVIAEHAQNWDLARIALLDRLLLRMAVCEFLTFEDIPPKVTINEIIEVAKSFSTEKSGQFINGILDAAVLELHRQGRLQKSGRGLVGMEAFSNQ